MASILSSPSRFYFTTNKNKNNTKIKMKICFKIFANFNRVNDDTIFKAAADAASIRFQESLRADPLYLDPYAGCLVSSVSSQQTTAASSPCYYSLVTKFIDDKLLSLVSSSDEIRQIVLLTDGMDTRPYRLNWPRSSVIYDISPEKVFFEASKRLKGGGAKTSKACVLLHVPLESPDFQAALFEKGYSGNRPSVWVLQGLPLTSLSCFEDMLSIISSLATEGCMLMGELPDSLLNAKGTKHELEKLFLRHGFQVNVIAHAEITRNLQLDSIPGKQKGVVFTARQLRLSDAQMETWRQHFGRLEEEGDEDGFEEM